MKHDIEVMFACAPQGMPTKGEFLAWSAAALEGHEGPFSLAIRLVDENEGLELNRAYRGGKAPTNVLSFPAVLPDDLLERLDRNPLGDIALCVPVVEREAAEQDKQPGHHWAHLTVHGILHLLGYLHDDDAQAQRMETREREILAGLGLPDPYSV
jgi:probable rRNA maturation factor